MTGFAGLYGSGFFALKRVIRFEWMLNRGRIAFMMRLFLWVDMRLLTERTGNGLVKLLFFFTHDGEKVLVNGSFNVHNVLYS